MKTASDRLPERAGVVAARAAQVRWAEVAVGRRLRVVRAFRGLLAERCDEWAELTADVCGRPAAEKLASEVLPLADACKWLERNAGAVLKPKRHGVRGRPLWLQGVRMEIRRRALGLVLVIGPGNYPLFLPCVQVLQALAAGNAVLLKPAPGTRRIALEFHAMLVEAGLDPSLLAVLEERVEDARDAIGGGVDKVVFTGSSENGRDVMSYLAGTNTPAVMELSGDDPVVVFDDADLGLVAGALRFGLRLNGGETCMVPRRVFAQEGIARRVREVAGGLPVEEFRDEDSAHALVNALAMGLGVSVFTGTEARGRAFAREVRSGFAVVNDVIAPTADPRMPFGGIKGSGFGSTRGAEGLLEMTHPHVVVVRGGRRRWHFDDLEAVHQPLFSSYIRAVHGGSGRRLRALVDLAKAALRVQQHKTRKS
ncbi:MAG: aldehyde dehydrogenase family protein [Verrucomicrobiales bacterium]|nr:aldehyde dehydrogenase family protein [Verrucomicrobiota bacterium JB025]